MNTSALPPEAEDFVRKLSLGLGALPRDERDDIVREVRSHLRDRQALGKEPILDGFEDADTYASRFLSEVALRDALARGTSVELGRALLVGAKTGLVLLTVAPLLTVQFLGAVLVLVGALKPFMPSRVGLFLDVEGRFVALGAYGGGDLSRLHEVLGYGAMPLFMITGLGLLWAGNRALRGLAKWRLDAVRAKFG